MLGLGQPHQEVAQKGDLFLVEDFEQCTYTLYRTVETFGNIKPSTEKKLDKVEIPQYYDRETGILYVLEKVGEAPNNELGLDSLLAVVNGL